MPWRLHAEQHANEAWCLRGMNHRTLLLQEKELGAHFAVHFILQMWKQRPREGKLVESCPGVALCSWIWRVPGNTGKGR